MPIQQEKIEIPTTNSEKPFCYYAFIDFLFNESFSSIPMFMKYFAFHECIVLLLGGLYWMQPDVGVMCLSIFPGLSVIGIFLHFLLTQFKNHKVKSVIGSIKHYFVALIIFILGLSSIGLIYHTNTYLSTLVPAQLVPEASKMEIFIGDFLKFPHVHSMLNS
eukprot:714464_1